MSSGSDDDFQDAGSELSDDPWDQAPSSDHQLDHLPKHARRLDVEAYCSSQITNTRNPAVSPVDYDTEWTQHMARFGGEEKLSEWTKILKDKGFFDRPEVTLPPQPKNHFFKHRFLFCLNTIFIHRGLGCHHYVWWGTNMPHSIPRRA